MFQVSVSVVRPPLQFSAFMVTWGAQGVMC